MSEWDKGYLTATVLAVFSIILLAFLRMKGCVA